MKFLLTLALLLVVSVALSSATCYVKKSKLERKFIGKKIEGCIDNGEVYAPGTKWIDANCKECTCLKKKMHCCTIPQPVGYSEECEATLDEGSCTYKLVKKDNPSESCEFSEMIG
ncbi:beta-microseminoprotein-like [Discoglossus pictus]